MPWGGMRERLALLSAEGIDLFTSLGAEVDRIGVDDVIDAAAAAWSARRIGKGRSCTFPSEPSQRDRRHRRLIAIHG